MKKNDKPVKAELHKEAEARLKKPKKTAKPLTSEAETQRLIHELEVSQIELEMQNEELTQTRTDLESALRQYTDLYDFAPVGYYSLTRDGMIREANLAGKNLLGLEGKHSARHRLGAFVSHESLPAFNIFWGKLLSGQGKETCDLALETRKGRMLWGHLEATCFEGSEVSRIAITDITERKIAEDYLEKFKQIVASTSEGISLLDTNYRYVIVNKAYETFSNKRKEELIGITVAEYLGEAVFYEHIKPQFDKCLNGETIRYQNWFEYPTLGHRFVEVTYYPYMDARGAISGVVANTRDITERKQAEMELIQSEAKFRSTFDQSPVGAVMVGLDKRFTHCNSAFCNFLGYSEKELIGKTISDVTHPEDKEIGMDELKELVAGKTGSQAWQKRYLRKNGAIVWGEISIRLIRDANNKPAYFLPIIQDITERKLVEQALKESENRFRTLLQDVSTIAVQGYAMDGTTQYWNTASEKLYGYSAQEAIGKNMLDLIIPPEMRRDVWHAVQQMGETGEVIPAAELSLMRKDGSRVSVYSSHGVVAIPGSEPILFCLDVDLSERKQAEEALRESEARLRLITDNMVDLIAQFDAQAFFQYASPSYEKILGYRAGDLIGKSAVDLLHPDKRDEIIQSIDAMLKLGTGAIQFRYRHKDGSYRWIESTGRNLLNADGQVIGSSMGSRDITERKQAEEALFKSEEKYRTMFENMSQGAFYQQADGTLIDVNASALEIFGLNREEFLGKTSRDPYWKVVTEDGNELLPEEHPSMLALKTGEAIRNRIAKVYNQRKNSFVWMNVNAIPQFKPDDGKPYQVFVTVEDITEIKRSEAMLKTQVSISQFADAHSLDEILQKTLDEAEALTNSQIGFAHFLEADQKTLELQMWSTNTIKNMCTAEGKGSHYPVDQAGVWVECIAVHAPVIHNDYASLPASRRKGLPQGHAPVVRELVVPVLRNDLIMMILGVGNKPTDYDEKDVETLSQLANSVWDIIQRKKAEEALHLNEKLLNATQELSKIGGWEWDIENQSMAWTDQTYSIHGITKGEITTGSPEHIAKSLINYDPQDRQKILDAFHRCVEQGESYNIEVPFTSGTGTRMWIRTTARAELEGTRVVKVIGNIMDITERKQAQEALKQSEERFRMLFDKAPLGYQALDEEGRFLDVNQAWLDALGYTREEVIGNWFGNFLAAEYVEAFRERFPIFKAAGQIHSEFEMMHKNGSRHWIAFEGRIGYELDGNFKQTHCILQDITEAKLAGEKLQRNELMLRLFVEHSPAAIAMLDRDMKYISASRRYLIDYELPDQDLVGRSHYEIFPEIPEQWKEIHRRCLAGAIEKCDEDPFPRASGKLDWVRWEIRPWYDINGEIGGIIIFSEIITERKLAEAALQESELFIKSVLDSLPAHIAVLDHQGVILAVNEAWRKFAHENGSLDSADFVGTNYLAACNAAIQQGDPIATQVDQGIRAVLEGTLPQFSVEYSCNSPTNERWFTLTVIPQSKSQQGVIMVHQNITERVKAEEALRESEEKYRTVADFTYDWEAWRGPDGTYRYISPSCERISGHTAQEFLADSRLVEKITHPDDQQKIHEHFEKTFNESREQNLNLDFRIMTPNGETRWIGHFCTAVYGQNGQWLGRRESNRDITERKQTIQALEASTEFSNNLISSMQDGVSVLDKNGVHLDVNSALCQMTGFSREEIIGTGMPHLYWPAEEYERIQTAFQQTLKTGSGSFELTFRRKNGERFPVIVSPFAVRDNTGNTISYSATVKDITERVQAEKALEAANIELQSALALQEQLAHTDALTGINNRRHLYELAEHEFEIAVRYQQPLSVLMFDIDHFKEVNDTYGHMVGDQILQLVTQVAKEELRSADVIGRYGGEEFVIILPMTSAQQAYPLAERIRMRAAEVRMPTEKGEASVTLSIGIVEIPSGLQMRSIEALIRRADAAMYAAKQDGRNRTKIGGE